MPRERHGEVRRALRGISGRTRFALSITPMIDVVFLLLVYFVLTSGFVTRERLLRTEPRAPERETAPADGLTLEVEPLVISLSSGDEGTRITLPEGLAAVRDAQALEVVLRGALLSEDSPRGMFASDHPVRLAPAPGVPWADVVGAFHAVTRAGYRSIAFGGGR
jgi:biopolymer transport protein ExbD